MERESGRRIDWLFAQPVNRSRSGYMSSGGLRNRSFILAFVKPSFPRESGRLGIYSRRYITRLYEPYRCRTTRVSRNVQTGILPRRCYTRYTHDDIGNISIWISILHFTCIFPLAWRRKDAAGRWRRRERSSVCASLCLSGGSEP